MFNQSCGFFLVVLSLAPLFLLRHENIPVLVPRQEFPGAHDEWPRVLSHMQTVASTAHLCLALSEEVPLKQGLLEHPLPECFQGELRWEEPGPPLPPLLP